MYVEILGYDLTLDEHICCGWQGHIDLPDDLDNDEFIQGMASYLYDECGGKHFDRLWLIIPDTQTVAGMYREGQEFHLNPVVRKED